MKDEVEEFLRRVAQMRQQAEAQGKGQAQKPPPRPAPARQPAPPRPPQTLVQRPQSALTPPLEAEVVDAELADTADRFEKRLRNDMRGTEQIVEHTRHLGEEVNAADNKMEAHLHQVFDHQLGRLKKSASEAAPQAVTQPGA